jgi:DNA-binding NarL/FixJ family response regulator
VLDPSVTQKVIRRAVQAEPEHEGLLQERLTRRERDILHHLAHGSCNTEIAAQLHLSEGTVKNHISHILGKMNARDRAHAVRLAVEWGLLLED